MNDAIPLLNESILNCLFQPRYMTFELCVRLEPTSMLFAAKADPFYRQLKRLDVKEFLARERNVDWSRKIFNRCPNLETVDNVLVEKKTLKQDKVCIQLFSMMKSVSSVSIEFRGHYSPLTMLPLIGMTSLKHLKLSSRDVPSGDHLFNPPEEKLRVTSLECNDHGFISICHPDQLNGLLLNLSDVDMNELIEKLPNFINLEDLTITFLRPQINDELLSLVNFVSDVLQIDAFSLILFPFMVDETQFSQICEQSVFKKYIKHLSLRRISIECVPSILHFSQLRSLLLENVTCSLSFFLESLPNLYLLHAACFTRVKSVHGSAILCFESTFDKRYICL